VGKSLHSQDEAKEIAVGKVAYGVGEDIDLLERPRQIYHKMK
jgi:hypothetical protein